MRQTGTSRGHSRVTIAAAMMLGLASIATAAEKPVPGLAGNANAPWTAHVRRMDEALSNKDVSAAELAWHAAYLSALRSRRWEGLLEVGDASLRIGEVARSPEAVRPKARRLYLSALFRARSQGSLDGVLRTAEAFAALGDREVVERGLYMAERLAARSEDPLARERVREFASRLATRYSEAKRSAFEPF